MNTRPGDVAEWLGSGLQSRPHQFDSGRRLSHPGDPSGLRERVNLKESGMTQRDRKAGSR